MRGITDKTDKKEEIVKVDEHRAIKYRLVEEEVNLDALREEKEMLETALAEPEPTDSELIELGRSYHPYYNSRNTMQDRLNYINGLLDGDNL